MYVEFDVNLKIYTPLMTNFKVKKLLMAKPTDFLKLLFMTNPMTLVIYSLTTAQDTLTEMHISRMTLFFIYCLQPNLFYVNETTF